MSTVHLQNVEIRHGPGTPCEHRGNALLFCEIRKPPAPSTIHPVFAAIATLARVLRARYKRVQSALTAVGGLPFYLDSRRELPNPCRMAELMEKMHEILNARRAA